ncbi:hypothetical protein DSO57_1013297 [Entomophthora muscae]|uniref:Uncharacterized protein n=1 Tax=Entomophthora muscae TaxID=34485 RepID=A0ACC2SUX2_9FUNG|nr:hypothetical protein DSO57_1013297 [Entomophthora muscae]
MPPKPTTKATPKASKGKATPKKQSSEAKTTSKTLTPSPKPEETITTPHNSHFIYSSSDPQERLFHSPYQSLAGLPQGRRAGPGKPCTHLV